MIEKLVLGGTQLDALTSAPSSHDGGMVIVYCIPIYVIIIVFSILFSWLFMDWTAATQQRKVVVVVLLVVLVT